jgi:hypothetical protein
LEVIGARVIIECKIDTLWREHGFVVSAGEAAKAEKRHAAIAKESAKLLGKLAADRGTAFALDYKMHVSERKKLDSGGEFLSWLKQVAERPDSDPSFGGGRTKKPGRPHSRDPWNAFIWGGMSVYLEATGKLPTAWDSKHEKSRRYDSAFLRGLLILHDALPLDVQLPKSGGVLGSRAARIIESLKPGTTPHRQGKNARNN